MRIRSLLAASCGALLAGLVLAACDAAPGVAPPADRPPVLSDFTLDPAAVDLGELPPQQLDGTSARVPIALGVTVTDADGGSLEVRYVVLPPEQNAQPLATGRLTRTGGDRYEGAPTLALPTTQAGLYTVLLYAVDEAGEVSNNVRGLLRVTAAGEPPVIESVDVPEEVQRPAAGETEQLVLSAVVSDPDGPANILSVEMRPNGGEPIVLCDDGGVGECGPFASSGDAEAGDGRYTITVQIASTNQLGTNTFAFQAFDRFGLQSEVVTRTVRVVE